MLYMNGNVSDTCMANNEQTQGAHSKDFIIERRLVGYIVRRLRDILQCKQYMLASIQVKQQLNIVRKDFCRLTCFNCRKILIASQRL